MVLFDFRVQLFTRVGTSHHYVRDIQQPHSYENIENQVGKI